MSNEKIVKQSNNGVLTLTNYRVVYDAKTLSESGYMSIPIDQVAHCGLITSQKIWLMVVSCFFLLMAVPAFIAGQVKDIGHAAAIALAMVGAFFFVAFIASKKERVTIASASGGEISVKASMPRSDAIDFLSAVEQQRREFRP